MDRKPKVFISYAHEDQVHAIKLANDLIELGIDVWIDSFNLLPGDHWLTKIEFAIADCDFFLALLSSNSVSKRGFVQKELLEAIKILEQIPPGETYIIPVRLEGCTPLHKIISEYQFADLFPSWRVGLHKLATAILGESFTFDKITEQEVYDIVYLEELFRSAEQSPPSDYGYFIQSAISREKVVCLKFDPCKKRSLISYELLVTAGIVKENETPLIISTRYMGEEHKFIRIILHIIFFDSEKKIAIQTDKQFDAVLNWEQSPFFSPQFNSVGVFGRDLLESCELEIYLGRPGNIRVQMRA